MALSIAASAGVIGLHGGLLAMVLAQVALLLVIAVWRAWREDSKKRETQDP
jgi:hypothetical protein